MIIVSAVLTLTRSWHKVTTDRLGLHLIRNVMHFSGQNLWFFAVTMIPLAQVFALEFTQPIWVLLLSPLLLGERLTGARVPSPAAAHDRCMRISTWNRERKPCCRSIRNWKACFTCMPEKHPCFQRQVRSP